MKTDIKLAGVGGQGILSIATVIAQAATRAGLFIKQAEVHGMSQRGGDVQSDLRLSESEIFSDQIPLGHADLIIAMEPMEALRYLPALSAEGGIVTASEPVINIPDYPAQDVLLKELDALPRVLRRDIGAIALSLGCPRSANMVLLGMAAPQIRLLTQEDFEAALAAVFARKGGAVVEDNLKAFRAGLEAARGR